MSDVNSGYSIQCLTMVEPCVYTHKHTHPQHSILSTAFPLNIYSFNIIQHISIVSMQTDSRLMTGFGEGMRSLERERKREFEAVTESNEQQYFAKIFVCVRPIRFISLWKCNAIREEMA